MTKPVVTMALCSILGLLVATSAPAAGRPCADAVITDWTDGRVDGRYRPACYAEAIDALPEDVRAYSTAVDDISRALRERIRETRGPDSTAGEPASSDDPLLAAAEATPSDALPAALVWSALVAGLLVLAGIALAAIQLLRRTRVTHRHTGPVGQW